MVQLTFPQEVELRILIDYVSQRLGVRFLYDEQVANKRISVKASQPIPADTLLGVLESALKMKNLALVEAEVEGWKRIVPADNLPQIAVQGEGEPIEQFPGATAVTQTFTMVHTTPERVGPVIEPFLTKPGANTITLADQNTLIVTDYAQNLQRIARLIEAIDQAGPERVLRFYAAKHVDAAELAQQVTQSLANRAAAQEPGAKPIEISHDARTNQLMLVGTQRQLELAEQLIRQLDVDLGMRTEVYAFQYIDAERINRLVQEILDPLTVKRLYRSAVDPEDNLLIATTTDAVHERIDWFRREMDIESKRPGSAVKFYRIKYADAQEILDTLRAIEQQSVGAGGPSYQRGVSPLGRGGVGQNRMLGVDQSLIELAPGPNAPPLPGQAPPTPPAFRETPEGAALGPAELDQSGLGIPPTIVPGAARVSVDPNTNSIIVIADRAVQQVYADLIKSLDRRRAQVMIEAKVVILDTSNDFSLGVELSGGDGEGARRLLNFTSYGLSQVNPVTGALAIIPGRGFNWTLVDPDSAFGVIRALSRHARAKVLSAPQILVNDNATGSLASVAEVPFTSVNASTTVATTSFAGFAEAGTSIEVTPRISDEDYLQLDFTVSLNNFTGMGGEGIPPPRQTDEVVSSVTIPDGYTVIVGGLTRCNFTEDYEGVPLLGRIPVVKYLVGIETVAERKSTLFVFLRPVILRDDKFRDLKFISDRKLAKSTEKGNFPTSSPLLIR